MFKVGDVVRVTGRERVHTSLWGKEGRVVAVKPGAFFPVKVDGLMAADTGKVGVIGFKVDEVELVTSVK